MVNRIWLICHGPFLLKSLHSVRESALLGALPVLSNENVFAERPGLHLKGDPSTVEGHTSAAAELVDQVRSGNAMRLRDHFMSLAARSGTAMDTDTVLFGSWDYVAEEWVSKIPANIQEM